MNKKWLAIPALSLGLIITGCKHNGGDHAATKASASAEAHALATSSAAAVGKQILKSCEPKTALAQAVWFKNLVSLSDKGTETRMALASCAGVPHAKAKAFENDALTKGEAAVKAQAVDHKKGAVKDYVTTTLPELVVKYRG